MKFANTFSNELAAAKIEPLAQGDSEVTVDYDPLHGWVMILTKNRVTGYQNAVHISVEQFQRMAAWFSTNVEVK